MGFCAKPNGLGWTAGTEGEGAVERIGDLSYLPELMGICDRIAVMSRGVLSEARPVEAWTEHAIMDVATGG
jgi:hypothetical protein